MAYLRGASFDELFQDMQVTGNAASHAATSITLTDPGAGKGTINIVLMTAKYVGAGNPSGNLTITQGGKTIYTRNIVGIPVNGDSLPLWASRYPTGNGNVVITLADGGVGIIGSINVGWAIAG